MGFYRNLDSLFCHNKVYIARILSFSVACLMLTDVWESSCDCSHDFCAVDGGHRAVIFDRFTGVKNYVVGEGTHFLIPWVQRPIIYDVRSRPRNVPVVTGSKGETYLLMIYSMTDE